MIPNKLGSDIFAIYTDYESNYTGAYTAVIGMKVESLDHIPAGMIGREFEAGEFKKYIARGEMPMAVVNTWQEIWSKDAELDRKYTYDFEVYSMQSQSETPEVAIYIAVK